MVENEPYHLRDSSKPPMFPWRRLLHDPCCQGRITDFFPPTKNNSCWHFYSYLEMSQSFTTQKQGSMWARWKAKLQSGQTQNMYYLFHTCNTRPHNYWPWTSLSSALLHQSPGFPQLNIKSSVSCFDAGQESIFVSFNISHSKRKWSKKNVCRETHSDSHSCEVKPFWRGVCWATAQRCTEVTQKYNPNFLPSWEMLSIARNSLKAKSWNSDIAMTHSRDL